MSEHIKRTRASEWQQSYAALVQRFCAALGLQLSEQEQQALWKYVDDCALLREVPSREPARSAWVLAVCAESVSEYASHPRFIDDDAARTAYLTVRVATGSADDEERELHTLAIEGSAAAKSFATRIEQACAAEMQQTT